MVAKRHQYYRGVETVFTNFVKSVFSINETTHIQTSSPSCIDLDFIDQPNLSVNLGIHASLHSNCHHQIVHSSFNLNISYPNHIND